MEKVKFLQTGLLKFRFYFIPNFYWQEMSPSYKNNAAVPIRCLC